MLPTTLARGRATARGYGELLMLNPGSIPGLTAYRYSPYTIPTAAAAGSAAAAAMASALAAGGVATSQTSVLTPTVSVATPLNSQSPHQQLTATDQNSLLSSLAAGAQPAAAAVQQLAAVQQQQQQQHQHHQQQQQQQQKQQQHQQQQQQHQQQQQQLQQLQLLGLVGALNPHQTHPQPCTTISASAPSVSVNPPQFTAAVNGTNGNPAHHAHPTALAQMLAVNPAVAAATAAAQVAAGGPCKARTLPGTIAIENGSRQPNLNGLNYSMNDLINLQGLQTFDVSAANFQVPVGL